MTIDELVVHLVAIAPDQPLTDATWMWQGGGQWIQVPDVLDDWRDEFRRARYMLGRDPVEVALSAAVPEPGVPLPSPSRLPPADAATAPEGSLWLARKAAAYLGVSESWVRHHSAAGHLPCVRFGHNVRFDPAALRAFARGEGIGRGRVIAPTGK